jgi:hypothetical protein
VPGQKHVIGGRQRKAILLRFARRDGRGALEAVAIPRRCGPELGRLVRGFLGAASAEAVPSPEGPGTCVVRPDRPRRRRKANLSAGPT